jgi:hypothetical protein
MPGLWQATFSKQVTAAGFQLKGSGWYATDFKGGSTASPAPASTAGAKPADARGYQAADSKPCVPRQSRVGACGIRRLRQCLRLPLKAPDGCLAQMAFCRLLVIVPVAITVWVLHWIIGTLDQTLLILPAAWHPDKLLGFTSPALACCWRWPSCWPWAQPPATSCRAAPCWAGGTTCSAASRWCAPST